jgi:tellurite resistance protein TerC
MTEPLWMWMLFLGIVLSLLILDLGLFGKKNSNLSFISSIKMSGFYFSVAILFGLYLWWQLGLESFELYLTGLLVEKSLSLDNIFVMSMIFSSLSIPIKYQHRVLFYGVLGVIVLRAIMICIGAQLLAKFEWIMYTFAIFMLYTGVKMFFEQPQHVAIQKNPLFKTLNKHFHITKILHGKRFFIYHAKQLYITPLLVALLIIEFVDLVFAVDSIPAIFTITKDPYIVYTSNIFAILGLRALYFALASIIKRFYYLKYAVAVILIFIAGKIFISDLCNYHMPAWASLVFTVACLGIACVYSVKKHS